MPPDHMTLALNPLDQRRRRPRVPVQVLGARAMGIRHRIILMCGRFTREYTWQELYDYLGVSPPPHEQSLAPSYNVAPGQLSAIVRMVSGNAREVAVARWGLIPPRADDPSTGTPMINAHAEGIADDPVLRAAYRRRRCVVPVSAFYEWQAIPGRNMKQPWYIHPAAGGIMWFAGLWGRWEKAAKPVESFTIIMTVANAFMRRLHNRMPVILQPHVMDTWLNPDTPPETLAAQLVPAPDSVIDAHPVDARVNDLSNNDSSLVVPV